MRCTSELMEAILKDEVPTALLAWHVFRQLLTVESIAGEAWLCQADIGGGWPLSKMPKFIKATAQDELNRLVYTYCERVYHPNTQGAYYHALTGTYEMDTGTSGARTSR